MMKENKGGGGGGGDFRLERSFHFDISLIHVIVLGACITNLRIGPGVHLLGINPDAGDGQFGHYNMVRKSEKMTETLAYGYSSERTLQELSN